MHSKRASHVLVTLVIAGFALGACGQCGPSETTTQSPLEAAPQAASDKAPAAPAGKAPVAAAKAPEVIRIALPDDVVAVVGISSLDTVLASAKTSLELLDPTAIQPGFISATKEGIKESLGWKDIGWIKSTEPIRSILFNAKQYDGKAQFLAFPMTNKDAVLAALPDGAKQKEGDHVAVYENNGQTVFVDFIGDHAIYTDHPAFLERGRELFTTVIRDWVPARDVQIKLDLGNIYSLYMAELGEAKRQILESYTRDTSGIVGVDKLVAWQLEVLFSLFESSHQCDLDLWLDQKTLRASASFIPKEGTTLHTFTTANKGKRPSFAAVAPKTGYMNGALNFDLRELPALLTQLNEATVEVHKNVAALRPEDVAKIRAQLDLIMEYSPGDAALSVYVDGEFPAAVAAMTRLTDAAAVKAAYGVIIQTVLERAIAKLTAEGAVDIPLEFQGAKSLGKLITFLNGTVNSLGAKVALVDETVDGVSMAGLRVNVDWARFAAATGMDQGDPELFKIITTTMGEKFEAILAIKGDLCALAFGPKGAKVAADLAAGKSLGSVEPGLARLARDHAGALSFRFDTILKSLAALPALASKRAIISKVPTDRPMTATLNTNGVATTVTLGLPVDVMQALGAIEN